MNGNIDKNRKISVMGILNLTGDSYFAPSRCLDGNGGMILSEVIGRVGKMFEEGADIVDIGACSTRPGAALTDEDEEWRRLSPLMDVLVPGRHRGKLLRPYRSFHHKRHIGRRR